VAAVVAQSGGVLVERVDRALAQASAERAVVETRRTAREREMQEVRDRLRERTERFESLLDATHRDEVLRTELRLRLEAVQQRALEEWGVAAAALVEEYGPHLPVPASEPDRQGDRQAGRAFVREEQQARAEAAERRLARLGRVNPLALEEYAAAEERLAFLSEQLEDVERTRRDLLEIVRQVDDRVQEVFAEAFADTAREFETVFARLFPGGEGRLALTQPDDLLATGVEVEARPPGKRVKRLSLLSGGERSLVAVAFLVALFKARPSPFYVLDEVEAALEDVNLGRLLEIYEELRASSQLIVITHQKRTMEIADALYGASMRGDGVTAVISQRIREPQLA
jgi:chromosome segregation protein